MHICVYICTHVLIHTHELDPYLHKRLGICVYTSTSVLMSIPVYIGIYVCTYVYVCIYVHTNKHTRELDSCLLVLEGARKASAGAYRLSMHKVIYVHVYICIYVYMCTCVYACMSIHICVYMHTQTHTRTRSV